LIWAIEHCDPNYTDRCIIEGIVVYNMWPM
jgi:hypothetical protein